MAINQLLWCPESIGFVSPAWIVVSPIIHLPPFPRLLTLKKSLQPSPDAFVLPGDFLSPSVLSSVDQGRGMVDVLGRAGVILKERIRRTNYPICLARLPFLVSGTTHLHEVLQVLLQYEHPYCILYPCFWDTKRKRSPLENECTLTKLPSRAVCFHSYVYPSTYYPVCS